MARRHLPTPRPSSVDADPQTARAGFVLYVGLNGAEGTGRAAELAEVAEALRDLARDMLPTAETYTALSLVPGTGTDDVRDLRERLTQLRPLPGPDAPVAETA